MCNLPTVVIDLNRLWFAYLLSQEKELEVISLQHTSICGCWSSSCKNRYFLLFFLFHLFVTTIQCHTKCVYCCVKLKGNHNKCRTTKNFEIEEKEKMNGGQTNINVKRKTTDSKTTFLFNLSHDRCGSSQNNAMWGHKSHRLWLNRRDATTEIAHGKKLIITLASSFIVNVCQSVLNRSSIAALILI